MRLIDADARDVAMLEAGQANKRGRYRPGDIWELNYMEIRDVISSQPTIDAVPVIRCEDCVYYKWEIDMCEEPFSTAHNVVHESDYCSRAVRKENDKDD
jgi:hypothetical protein